MQILDELQVISGVDIPTPLGITFKQPRILDISILGEEKYFLGLSIISVTKKQLKIKEKEITNWAIFQETLNQKIEGIQNIRSFLRNFLQLFFYNNINLGPRSIIIDCGADLINIDESNFDLFQILIQEIGGISLLEGAKEEEFKPANARAAQIVEKLKKSRKKLADLQKVANLTDSKSFLKKYIKCVVVGTKNSLEQVLNMTILQLNEVVRSYLAWEAYDLDVRSRLAGSQTKEKLVHWLIKEDLSTAADRLI